MTTMVRKHFPVVHGRLLCPGFAVLADVAGYVTCGAPRPVVHSVFPLADIAAAHAAFERGGVVGKHVVAIAG